jgi:hypothetical protein
MLWLLPPAGGGVAADEMLQGSRGGCQMGAIKADFVTVHELAIIF